NEPWTPHAQTTVLTRSRPLTDAPNAALTHALLSGPTGSAAAFIATGLVARTAKRLTTRRRLHPHRRAKPWHLRTVGSSTNASAVEGLSMINVATRSPAAMRRAK